MKKRNKHRIPYQPKAKTPNPDSAAIAKNAFITNVSHEIRTPMNAIMGFAQMLKCTELNPKQNDYVDVILDSGKKLLMLISNLLDLSNLQMGKTNLFPADSDPAKLVERIWSHYRPLIIAKNLKPLLQMPESLPIVIVDEEKVVRVVSFVLSNAIKFTDAGSIVLRVNLVEDSAGAFLDFEVEDTGCGIAEDKVPYIFDVFEQADNSMTRAYPGLGLGLGLSGKIVALLGGEISAASKLGEGTCFHIKIPVGIY